MLLDVIKFVLKVIFLGLLQFYPGLVVPSVSYKPNQVLRGTRNSIVNSFIERSLLHHSRESLQYAALIDISAVLPSVTNSWLSEWRPGELSTFWNDEKQLCSTPATSSGTSSNTFLSVIKAAIATELSTAGIMVITRYLSTITRSTSPIPCPRFRKSDLVPN